MSSPIADDEFRECYLATGQYAGVQTLVGWYCARCGALVPNITDMPPDRPHPKEVHRAHHEFNDRP